MFENVGMVAKFQKWMSIRQVLTTGFQYHIKVCLKHWPVSKKTHAKILIYALKKMEKKNHFDPKVWPFVPRAQLWKSIMIFWAHGNFSSGFLWISLYSSDSRTNRPVINLHLFYFCEPPKLYFGLQRDQTTASQITFKFKRSLNWKLLLPNKWLFIFRQIERSGRKFRSEYRHLPLTDTSCANNC